MHTTDRQHTGNCPFCDTALAEQSFLRSENFMAIYNIAPVLPGHSLVIPLRHASSVFDLTEPELSEMMVLARNATSVLQQYFGCDGFDWSVQDGVSAGQTVMHLHLHIVPRKSDDLPKSQSWYGKVLENEKQYLDSLHRPKLTPSELDDITAMLRTFAGRHNILE